MHKTFLFDMSKLTLNNDMYGITVTSLELTFMSNLFRCTIYYCFLYQLQDKKVIVEYAFTFILFYVSWYQIQLIIIHWHEMQINFYAILSIFTGYRNTNIINVNIFFSDILWTITVMLIACYFVFTAGFHLKRFPVVAG